MRELRIKIDKPRLSEFCRKWKVRRMEFFGSVLRSDFRSDSDVDILITFEQDADWGLMAHVEMEEELSLLLGRKVDLISRKAVERSENRIRREAILTNAVAIDD